MPSSHLLKDNKVWTFCENLLHGPAHLQLYLCRHMRKRTSKFRTIADCHAVQSYAKLVDKHAHAYTPQGGERYENAMVRRCAFNKHCVLPIARNNFKRPEPVLVQGKVWWS